MIILCQLEVACEELISYNPHLVIEKCRDAEIGRQAGLRIQCPLKGVQVRFLFSAQMKRSNLGMTQISDTDHKKTAILKNAYAALNRGDISGFTSLFDSNIVRTEFLDTPTGGTYRGIDAVRAHVTHGRGTWAEGTCEIEELQLMRELVIATVHVHVRLKGSSKWIDGYSIDVFTFDGDKVVRFDSFSSREKALAEIQSRQ